MVFSASSAQKLIHVEQDRFRARSVSKYGTKELIRVGKYAFPVF